MCCVRRSSFSSGGYFVQQSTTGLAVLVEGLMSNICVKIFLNYISCAYHDRLTKTIWAILVEEHFCEIILNLDQWLRRRCRLKIFLIHYSGGHLVQRSGTN